MTDKIRKIIDKYFWAIFIGFIFAIFFVLFLMIKGAMASDFPYDAKTITINLNPSPSPYVETLIAGNATKTILFASFNVLATETSSIMSLYCGTSVNPNIILINRDNNNVSTLSNFKCAGDVILSASKAGFFSMTYVDYDTALFPPETNIAETGKETWDIEFNGTTSKLYFTNSWTAGDVLIVFSMFCFAVFYIAKTIIKIFVKKYVSIRRLNQ
jgi:hypothetical protein